MSLAFRVRAFGAERLRNAAGFQAQHLAIKGAAEAVTDVVADRADFNVQLTATTVPLSKDGKLLALAISVPKRAAALPDTPTTIELGLPPGIGLPPFYIGVFVPAKTPPAVGGAGSQAEFFKYDVDSTVALARAANIQQQ